MAQWHIVRIPFWIQWLTRHWLVWKIPADKKVLFLTFDDGPNAEVTPKVLHLLKSYNAKATFFMVGENVLKFADTYQQVIEDGHSVGHHCFNHLPFFKTNPKSYFRNVLKGNSALQSPLFRPPHGQIGWKAMKLLSKKYKIMMWTVMSYDFDKSLSADRCAKNVISKAKAGDIIVFHDSLKAQDRMVIALEKTLIHFSKLGYEFHAIEVPSSRHDL
jgi:peptidoglycan/xylan/chitin deacetylase (PgdA/CDA1 family)